MSAATITQEPVRVTSRRRLAVRFPVAGGARDRATREVASRLVLGRRCRRRAVAP